MSSTAEEKGSDNAHTDAIQPHYEHVAPTNIKLHHDAVAPEAIGGLYHEMPAGYYRSPKFIGTVVVSYRILPYVYHHLTKIVGRLFSPDFWISWLGASSKHTALDQRIIGWQSQHYLGSSGLDHGILYWFLSGRTLV